MKNKILLIDKTILIINIIIYCFLVIVGYIYNMSYLKCIIFMIINSIFIYIYGIVVNKENVYKSNSILYIILFMILLFTITFIIGRPKLEFYNWCYRGQYFPFNTIVSQFKYASSISILKNIVGNSIMLIPLSFLLMIRNKKFNNIFKQAFIVLPIIIFIEILQAYTHTGTFDIDDILLNYMGTLIFTFLITRFNIIDKIRDLFYTDFRLNNKVKDIIFYLVLIMVIIYDIVLFIS